MRTETDKLAELMADLIHLTVEELIEKERQRQEVEDLIDHTWPEEPGHELAL